MDSRILEEIKRRALEDSVPIIEDDGLDFMVQFIENQHIQRILEIGTAVGYSSICFCNVSEDVTVLSIEKDEDRYRQAVQNIRAMNLENRITVVKADAREYETEEMFDMIFLDGPKAHNAELMARYEKNLRNGGYLSERGSDVRLPNPEAMMAGTCFYADEQPSCKEMPAKQHTEVEVLEEDCLLAANLLKKSGFNPAVLNMASRRNPGGGVLTGAGAQEENLFRRTNLCLSMYQFASYADEYGLLKSENQYPLDPDFGGVYTPDACVFRGLEKEGYPLLDEWYSLSFISVAGLNRPTLDKNNFIVPEQVISIKNKIRTIFRMGLHHGHDALVLGALGCGAFRNPPAHIARLFHEIMEEEEFKDKYRKIVFAIIEDHNSRRKHNPEGNLIPFQREFSE